MDAVSVPVIIDAGVGTASDVAVAFELGCDAVLLNTAIAGARLPVLMATAMRHAAEAGRAAFLAGRIAKRAYATASTPSEGMVAAVSEAVRVGSGSLAVGRRHRSGVVGCARERR